jgi:hypothetical protein
VEFFDLSNPKWLSVSLAIAFELGAAASLASIIALDRMNKFMVWGLFIILTLMQAMGNSYYAYTNIQDYSMWSELFGLSEEDPIFQKRILSVISGAILPLVALGFIKSLVDYIKPVETQLPDEIKGVEVQESSMSSEASDLREETSTETSDSGFLDTSTQNEIEAQPDFDNVNPVTYVNSNHRNMNYGPDPTNLK